MAVVTRSVKNTDELALLKVYLEQRKRPFTVEITDGRDRSSEQNRLSHKWYKEISDQTGEAVEDVRARCKLKFGIPILMESSEAFRDLCRRRIKPLTHEERIEVIRDFDIPVTRLLNVGQMSQYMDEVFKSHSEYGIILSIPADKYAFSTPRDNQK